MFRVEYAFMRVGIMVECSHVTVLLLGNIIIHCIICHKYLELYST